MAIEDLTIDYPCPECGQRFEVGLYQLLLKWGLIICPRCAATNVEDFSSEFRLGLKSLRKAAQSSRLQWQEEHS